MTHLRESTGFTLIEMLVVLVISGVIAVFVAQNISRPIDAFNDTARRAALVDAAAGAIERVTREARLALPNSVRISGGVAVEFLRTRTGGRYRARVDPGKASDPLDFTDADPRFDVLGELKAFGQICAATSPSCGGGTASTAACMANPSLDCLVVYNTGQPADCNALTTGRSNAYCGDNVAGINIADAASATIDFVNDRGAFPLASPQQRFYVVDTPVSYICNLAQGTLVRYDGYAIGAVQPTLGAPPATAGRVLADKLVACDFSYDPGNASRAALLTIRLTLADSAAPSERVTLLAQAHVQNVP